MAVTAVDEPAEAPAKAERATLGPGGTAVPDEVGDSLRAPQPGPLQSRSLQQLPGGTMTACLAPRNPCRGGQGALDTSLPGTADSLSRPMTKIMVTKIMVKKT
jgi:hypothetical protein